MSNCGVSFLRKIYFLYVFFLPFGSFIKVPEGALGTLLQSMSINIMLIGMLVIIVNKGIRKIKEVNPFWHQYLFMVYYSLVAAACLSLWLNNQPKSPFECIVGDIVLYFLAFLSIYFNYYCLNHVVRFRQLYLVFDVQIIVSIAFGLFQICAILGIGPCPSIYNNLTNVLSIMPIDKLIIMDRGITIFGTEPATLVNYCFISIPYILVRFFHEKKHRLYYAVCFVLFIALFIASNSTQTLSLFVVMIVSCICLSLNKRLLKPLKIGAFIAGMSIAFYTTYSDNISIKNSLASEDSESLLYTVLGKVVDQDNPSTQMRSSTIINDIKIFTSLIVVGVGDGCQGYWYKDNIPSWCKYSNEVNELLSTNTIPNGGGAFFPSYLSAYGLIGVFFLILFLISYNRIYNHSFLVGETSVDLFFYQAPVILLLIGCWVSITLREFPIGFFTLSLALCKKTE